jgi:hypothetical protein
MQGQGSMNLNTYVVNLCDKKTSAQPHLGVELKILRGLKFAKIHAFLNVGRSAIQHYLSE